MEINFESGGADVLDRIIKAYGFTTKLALANYLNISAASLGMRYKRDNFPADLVVRCMAETNATLEWLTTGEGEFSPQSDLKESVISDQTLEKLERLAALRKDGAITEQEFNELKGKLI